MSQNELNVLSPSSHKSRLIKILILIFILGSLFGFFRYILYGSLFSNCRQKEIKLEIPEELKGAYIIFELPMAVITPAVPTQSPGCIKPYQVSQGRQITTTAHLDDSGKYYTFKLIEKDQKFFIVSRFYEKNIGFTDASDLGDSFLLQDEKGKLYTITLEKFHPFDFKLGKDVYSAGYYKGEKRIGPVDIKDEKFSL